MFKAKKQPVGLISRICNYWRTHVDEEECKFYRTMLKETNGKALELACGGGRLILRFLHEGFQVDGVDSCPFLLNLLRHKAEIAGLKPNLYHDRIEAIELAEASYRLIYIPLGSFQLIADRELAILALSKYYALLEQGGRLVITLFLPWTQEPLDTNGWQIIRDAKLIIKNQRYVERECTTHDPVEQIIMTRTRFELWDEKDLLQFEQREIHLRWYSQGEILALLKTIGFTSVKVQRSYSNGPPYKDAFMLIIAQK